jgi:DNA-binding FadR family transcriptional regulator
MRRGHKGGLVVTQPSFDAVNEALSIYFEFSQVRMEEIFGTRSVLEQFSAAVAATSRDEEHVLALQKVIQDEARPDAEEACAAAFNFHVLVAEATRNVALLVFIQALASLTDRLLRATSRDGTRSKTTVEEIHRDHKDIAEAIAFGDSLRARAGMLRHLELLKEQALKMGVPPFGSVHTDRVGRQLGTQRLAATIAEQIRQDIVASGWPVGASLGTEAELLQRYGVSRAPFREAVRILESHSVVRMRRGSDGGMVVTAPDGREVIRAVSLYLRYRGMDRTQIREVREELEIAILGLAIEQLTLEGIQRLRETLAREQSWPNESFPAVSHDLHRVIAEICGNRAMAFLVSIIMQLTAERLSTAAPAPESPDAVRHAHQLIVDAMVAQDIPLATRRMRKHLRALSDAIPHQ